MTEIVQVFLMLKYKDTQISMYKASKAREKLIATKRRNAQNQEEAVKIPLDT